MLDTQFGGIRYKISLLFPAVLLFLLLIDHTGLATFGFLAAVIHECGHLVALRMMGERPRVITVSFYGMRMELPVGSRALWREIAIYAGGPLVNLLCAGGLFLMNVSPIYAWLHGLLAAVNLLPVMPLDGGQILRCVLEAVVSSDKAWRRLDVIGWSMLVMLAAGGILLMIRTGNFTLSIMVFYLVMIKLFYKGN